ncbi:MULTISPECIES: 2-hydroxyacyl-CoA dehydratase family protein [Microbacterium]|uniref:2-hydroxyacyl-CoA dehydratase n=1 Tax=Microbacterium wangchenii TaxID=2541726 RepID=A0ABX5SX38_9MICO|nr:MULTISPECIES: 2-hydroxyacyl-CoA dehydratase family protein [Microbacterium]MCK6066063.1 2-hydroxyacyl-CoA dehydratase family protein [Microbacterium sp. EYE_512]QBR90347.1 2-hydroxyacyl-CoA dehydratase [Microbacterium wangchenii]TXK11637.1 2-hydroxyacyl-CoA dehydratase [Microbacterium wangchenii]
MTPTIGIVGNDVPRQIVRAAGAAPQRLTGSWAGAVDRVAADHLGAVDRSAAVILTGLMGAATDALDALVVCNDSQANLRLFYVLRMLRGEGIPPVHLLDLPRQDTPATRRFARVQLAALTAFCERVSGRTADAAAWRDAAAEERAVGAAVSRLQARRRAQPPEVGGTTALTALLAAASAPPAAAVELLDAAAEPRAGGLRVHVTGSNHPDPSVYAALEASGATIVSDDHDTGDLSWLGAGVDAADADAVYAGLIDAHFARTSGSAVATIAERAATTRAIAVAAQADVVLALIRRGDEAPLWDLAAAADALADTGIALERSVGITAEGLDAAVGGVLAGLSGGEEHHA